MSEEVRLTSSTGAEKGSKLAKHSLIPPGPLNALAEHYGLGAEKYEKHNWRKGYDWSLSFDALMRHANAFWDGEDIDEELGSPHMAAVAFHAFTLLSFMVEHPEFDDRYKPDLKPESEDEVDYERVQRLWAELQEQSRQTMNMLISESHQNSARLEASRLHKEGAPMPHATVHIDGRVEQHFNLGEKTNEETSRIVNDAILHETSKATKECKCYK